MDRSNNIKILSFNCAGVSNKIPIISDFCSNFDVILLQETWLTPDNINFLNTAHADFCSHSVSAVKLDQPLVGRPHGGLSILWRRSLGLKCSIKLYDDPRLLGFILENHTQKLLIINVYLPYFSMDNYDNYLHYVGEISSITEDYDHNDVLVIGDFNAEVDSLFYHEWDNFCETDGMVFVDVEKLPGDSYTHVNNGSLTRSWLDHCLSSSSASRCIENIEILYDYFLSDHHPFYVVLKFDMLPTQLESTETIGKIKWDFEDLDRCTHFYRRITDKISCDPFHILCHDTSCHNIDHRNVLAGMWDDFVHIVTSEAKRIFGSGTRRGQTVPGWNDLVKSHYAASREAFLAWRRDNSPRQGATADRMRSCRARFKLALRQCRSVEQEARALALAQKFRNKNMKAFWKDIKSLNKNPSKLPTTVDDISGEHEICQLWKNRFENVLNSVNDTACSDELKLRLQNMEDTPVIMTSPDEISSIVDTLSSGKSPGTDKIPIEFFKNATPTILTWVCNFFNGLFIHEFIPQRITDVMLSPLLKSSLKDPCCSTSYRPIAHATAVSKIIENILLNRLDRFLKTTDFQFGFKKGHGTDTCIFLLKDMINYYRNLNTPVFLCFLDIKSCFDLVSYNKLFIILCDRGAPKYLILLLLNWYSRQRLYVRWGGTVSEGFGMRNGIRQGSCLSPRLFSAYVDELDISLKDSHIGCHVSGTCTNHLSYADDMVLCSPDAKSMNRLLEICQSFASQHFITYSPTKTEAMLIRPRRGMREFIPPKLYIGSNEIEYVESFKYLGHIIANDLSDDLDIEREIRNLYIRGNTIVRKFNFFES